MTQTREQWLENAVDKLRPLLHEVKEESLGDVPKVRVSVGWPSKGGTANKGKVIGQCWKAKVATDGIPQVFISPILGDAVEHEMIHMLGVLLHELIHAWDDCESGHKGRFTRIARGVGLSGKMTATVVSEELEPKLALILQDLGEYPHATLNFAEMEKQVPKQTTRMIKVVCPEDDYTIRTTQKWIDVGLPTCPCGTEMELA